MSNIYPIAVPKWGIEMVEGTIVGWSKELGDAVSKGDEVFEMESDKIVNVWESPVDGVLRRRIAKEGDAMAVGGLLGIIASADVDDGAIDAFIKDFAGSSGSSSSAPAAAPAKGSIAPGDASAKTNPVVRRLATELGVDLNTLVGTGRRGRITKEDVEAAAQAGAQASSGNEAVSDDVNIIPLSPTRKTIAKRLTKAKQEIPHYYLTAEYELDGLLAHREKLNQDGEQRVSVNDLLVWCSARALMAVPEVNINLIGDDIHQFKHANVAVAIATKDGLYPATVRNADSMTPQEIAATMVGLAEKANSGSLKLEDISGASFTVSNLGMYGVNSFAAIVNPPMCAILALGKGEQKVVAKDGVPAVATVVNATLSCDHRAIDGALGARFLDALRAEIAAL
ncbi:MAG: pyruvate dehydrogenase E2 component (dihydrolipoamide acetyltransferase) [Halioglobus sp.]|jgi:pyruvate dehydrogenase E2 component (dihydrolipoamide acetyltransferase)